MAKQQRKLTSDEKRAKHERRLKYRTIFVNGKQKRVLRPVLIDGLTPEEYLIRNGDPIALHEAGLGEHITHDMY